MSSLLLTLKMAADSSEATKEIDKVEHRLSGFATGAAKAVGGMAAVTVGAVGAIGAAVGALTLKGGFDRAMNIEAAQAKLKGIGKSAEDITEIMKSATAAVTGTSFGLGEAATIAASAVAAGVKPGQELTKYLRLTANAAALTGNEIADMGAILNKVTTRGKASTEEINQLNEAGIPILVNLAKHYKVSSEAMSDMVSKGKVDAATLQLVLEQTVGNAAEEMGKTVAGSFKNMRTAMSRLGETFLSGAFTQLPALFQGIGRAFDALKPIAKSLGAIFGRFIGKEIGNVVEIIDSRLIPSFQTLGAWFDHLIAVLALFRLSHLGEQADESSDKINTKLMPSMHDVGEFIIRVAVWIQETLIPAIRNAVDHVEDWFNRWRQAIYGVSGDISNVLFGAWHDVVQFIKDHKDEILNWWADWKQIILDVSDMLSSKLFGAWKEIVQYIIDHKDEILEFLKDHKEEVEKVAAGVGAAVGAWKLAKEGIEAAQGAIETLTGLQEAFNVVTEANPWVLIGIGIAIVIAGIVAGLIYLVTQTDKGKEIWNTAWQTMSDAASKVWNEVLKPIYDWFNDKWNELWPTVKETMETAWNGIGAALSWVYNTILKPMFDYIADHMDMFKNLGIALAVVAGIFVVLAIAALAVIGVMLLIAGVIGVIVGAIIGVLFVVLLQLINVFWDVFNNVRDALGAVIDFFENMVQVIWDLIQNLISFVWNLIQVFWDLFNNIADAVGRAKDWVFDRFNEIVNFISGLPQKIKDAASGMWDGIKEAFKTAINWIIDAWNNLSFTLPNIPGTDIGGFTLDTPDIPRLAQGGIVRRPTLALVGEAGPEAVVPLGKMGGTTINVSVTHTGLAVDNPRLQRDLVETLSRFVDRNGPLQLPVRSV